MEEKGWKKWREWLSRGYKWGIQYAKRRSTKVRAMGRTVMGIKRGAKKGKEIEVREEGVIVGDIKWKREKWRVVGVYVGGEIEESLQRIEKWEEREGKRKVLVGGDFNARIGKEGGRVEEEGREGRGEGRQSKDGKINERGRSW